jgi:hypothetical protein
MYIYLLTLYDTLVRGIQLHALACSARQVYHARRARGVMRRVRGALQRSACQVYYARRVRDDHPCVVKMVSLDGLSEQEEQEWLNEVRCMPRARAHTRTPAAHTHARAACLVPRGCPTVGRVTS